MCEDVLSIREDEYLRNRFIERYKPFLAKYASQICHRYLQYGENEELSIALLAFNESIDRYDGRGIFFEYSKTVIKSRLFDYFQTRSYKEKNKNISFEDENGNYYLNKTSMDYYHEDLRQDYLKEEIEELNKVLKFYDMNIIDVYESRPKHLLSRKHIHKIIKEILVNKVIVSHIIDKGTLPIKLIMESCYTTKKKIEPYRKYIISVVIICEGNFELLKEYMPEEVRRL